MPTDDLVDGAKGAGAGLAGALVLGSPILGPPIAGYAADYFTSGSTNYLAMGAATGLTLLLIGGMGGGSSTGVM